MRRLADVLLARRPRVGPFLIAITGGVAVGKSTLSSAIADELRGGGSSVATVGTDAFLFDNVTLEARGLSMEKGFPASYDVDQLRSVVGALRGGGGADVPSYSHRTYDIEPGVVKRVEPADVTILEGLHLTQFVGDLVDVTVHLDAPADVVEEWYVARMVGMVAAARDDPESFYRLFVALDDATVDAIARDLWATINLVNLRQNIDPWLDRADVVVHLSAGHEVLALDERSA